MGIVVLAASGWWHFTIVWCGPEWDNGGRKTPDEPAVRSRRQLFVCVFLPPCVFHLSLLLTCFSLTKRKAWCVLKTCPQYVHLESWFKTYGNGSGKLKHSNKRSLCGFLFFCFFLLSKNLERDFTSLISSPNPSCYWNKWLMDTN